MVFSLMSDNAVRCITVKEERQSFLREKLLRWFETNEEKNLESLNLQSRHIHYSFEPILES